MESGKPSQSPSSYTPPTTAEELLRRYAVGERYFGGAEIADAACFRGAVLVDAVLDGAWLFDADFRKRRPSARSFQRVECKVCQLCGC